MVGMNFDFFHIGSQARQSLHNIESDTKTPTDMMVELSSNLAIEITSRLFGSTKSYSQGEKFDNY